MSAAASFRFGELEEGFHPVDRPIVRRLVRVGIHPDEEAGIPTREFEALVAWCSTFYPYQLDWLLDPAKFAICCKSRQIGMSHTSSGLGVLWGAFMGQVTTIVSKTDDLAMETLGIGKNHARLLQDFGSEWAAMVGVDNKHEVEFASGGRIIAKPSTGPMGYTGNVVLDEFAHVLHADDLWKAALPAAMLGDFKVRILSTPNGIGNKFHETWERATNPEKAIIEAGGVKLRSQWSPHLVPLARARAAGYRVNEAECWEMASGDPRIYNQLFNCAFLDAVLQYIPTDLIEACSNDLAPVPIGGEHFAGLDVGKEVDLTVLVVLRQHGRKRWVVHVEVMRRTDLDGLLRMVDHAFARYKIRRLCVDANGLGAFPAEQIKKKHSESHDIPKRRPRVELNNFHMNDKEVLATRLFMAMNEEQLVLPKDDAALPRFSWTERDEKGSFVRERAVNEPGEHARLRRDLASIQRVVTRAGNVTYDAPRTSEGHADRAWALALANHAAGDPHPVVDALMSRIGR